MKLLAVICALALIATPALAGGGWGAGDWTLPGSQKYPPAKCRGCAAPPAGWPSSGHSQPVNPGEAPKTIDGWTEPPLPPQPPPVSLSVIFGGNWSWGMKNNPSGITKLLPGARLNKQGWLDAHWGHFDPPAEFDPLEHPYKGDLTIIKTSMQHVKEICPIFQPGIPPLACATHDPGWCRVTIARDEDIKAVGWEPNRVLRHELAHCNGWPGDHPGAR
jgi:hypothetical protein